mmetsp:Transcript_19686/g.21386  ORF Transcript_19686/g.21386 Transcript_19686/m.21386 type:complete len:902 (+) Transcript_19686:58-2763(+)
MDNKVSQYQRAVTPTLETSGVANTTGVLRGKILTYASTSATAASTGGGSNRVRSLQVSGPSSNGSYRSTTSMSPRVSMSGNADSGSSTSGKNNGLGVNAGGIATFGRNILPSGGSQRGSFITPNVAPDPSSQAGPSNSSNLLDQYILPRYDLVPISEEMPSDGIIFAKIRGQADSLVIFRTPEERLRNPERLNLDRRQLEFCPILEQEHRLRLLNYQNNHITQITNLENLPNLIFLDLYNNHITSLDGPLGGMRGLRVLMAGKNRIQQISNLEGLKKLDVLDLHSNEIKAIEGLDGLSDLRVLNLAGNRISQVAHLTSLISLTELNLRRNQISSIEGLDKLPSLQRVFLSHNSVEALYNISCVFQITYLIELSMDGNPVAELDPVRYRNQIIAHIPSLKHLDLKRITDEERSLAIKALNTIQVLPQLAIYKASNEENNDYSSTNQNNQSNSRNLRQSIVANGEGAQLTERESAAVTALGKKVSLLDLHGAGKDFILPDAASSTQGNATRDLSMSIGASFISPEKESEDLPPSDSTNHLQNSNGLGMNVSSHSASTAMLDQNNNNVPPGTASTTGLGGLVALAKAGRISKAQNLFDVEIINSEEKAIIGIGDGWDWNVPKRLYPSITEVYLVHMKREAIIAKFPMIQLQSLVNAKKLFLISNDFTSLKQIQFIPSLYGQLIEHLTIKDSPIMMSAPSLVKAYIIANMAKLQSFNEEPVTSSDRSEAQEKYSHFFNFSKKNEVANKHFIQGMKFVGVGSVSHDGGGGNGAETSREDMTGEGGNNNGRKRRFYSSASANAMMSSSISPIKLRSGGQVLNRPPSPSPSSDARMKAITVNQTLVSYESYSEEFDRIFLDLVASSLQSYQNHYGRGGVRGVGNQSLPTQTPRKPLAASQSALNTSRK